MNNLNLKTLGITFSILIPLVVVIFLTSNFAFSEEENGSIEFTLQDQRGDRTGTYGVELKVFQDKTTLIKEISDIERFPFIIESLTINREYTIEVHYRDMLVSIEKINMNKPKKSLTVTIPDNIGLIFQVLYNDGKVIPNVDVEIKSHIGNVWARDSTGPDGLTGRIYLPQSIDKNNFYVAEFSLEPNLVHIVDPVSVIRVPGIPQTKIVTEWPSLIEDLITIKVHDESFIKSGNLKEKYLVEMYDRNNQKIDESFTNTRGEAFFSLIKVGTYSFSVSNKPEGLNEFQEITTKQILLDGTKNSFNVNIDENTSLETEDPKVLVPVKPAVKITDPTSCAREIFQGTVRIEGTASSESGIQKVEVFANTFPHNGTFPFKLATPIKENDWSKWFIDLEVSSEPHRILARAEDRNGIPEWHDVDINLPSVKEVVNSIEDESSGSKIAFVAPTFRDTVYKHTAAYKTFYGQYRDVPPGQEVTTDLHMLTGPVPSSATVDYFLPLFERVKQLSPESSVIIIRDEDVHVGNIFRSDNTNAYDVLFLFHTEYVTQTQFDNYIQFLKNGGTIVMMSSNAFYAEVQYIEDDCTVTLIKGHDWEFDGNSAKKSVMERYTDEKSEWFGNNFIKNHIFNDGTYLENNRFNYTWYEEDEVTNRNATVLLDFKVKFPQPANPQFAYDSKGKLNETGGITGFSDEGKTVGVYELLSGNGKVLHMALYFGKLFDNPLYMDYVEKIVLPRVIGNIYPIEHEDEKFDIYWIFPQGEISDVELNEKAKSITLKANLDPINIQNEEDSFLIIVLPTRLIDAKDENIMDDFFVTIDGVEVPYEHNYDDIERSLKIKIEKDSEITIIGTTVVPEFHESFIMIIVFVMLIGMSWIFFKRLPRKIGYVVDRL